jgi:hypothetical protein
MFPNVSDPSIKEVNATERRTCSRRIDSSCARKYLVLSPLGIKARRALILDYSPRTTILLAVLALTVSKRTMQAQRAGRSAAQRRKPWGEKTNFTPEP